MNRRHNVPPASEDDILRMAEVRQATRQELQSRQGLFGRAAGRLAMMGSGLAGYAKDLVRETNDKDFDMKYRDDSLAQAMGHAVRAVAPAIAPVAEVVQARAEKARAERAAAQAAAVEQYHAQHPEVRADWAAKQAAQEQALAVQRHAAEQGRIAREQSSAQAEINAEQLHIAESLQRGLATGSVYSVAKYIPRRSDTQREEAFTGDYADLASDTLRLAAENRDSDGVIVLLGGTQSRLLQPEPSSVDDVHNSWNDAKDYNEGVTTLLWQAGFMRFENEKDVAYGKGAFAADIEDDGEFVRASIAYNPANQLHRMIAPQGGVDSLVLQMSRHPLDEQHGDDPYLSLYAVPSAHHAETANAA